MDIKYDELKQEIADRLSLIPGVTGFVEIIQNNEETKALRKNQKSKGIFILEGNNGLRLKLSILINPQINSKAIVSGVNTAVKDLFIKKKMKCESIDIMVRGVLVK